MWDTENEVSVFCPFLAGLLYIFVQRYGTSSLLLKEATEELWLHAVRTTKEATSVLFTCPLMGLSGLFGKISFVENELNSCPTWITGCKSEGDIGPPPMPPHSSCGSPKQERGFSSATSEREKRERFEQKNTGLFLWMIIHSLSCSFPFVCGFLHCRIRIKKFYLQPQKASRLTKLIQSVSAPWLDTF